MKNLNATILILMVLLLIACVINGNAQDNDDTPIKVNTVLVNVPVIVSDKDGRRIAGLKKEDFSVSQGGEKQIIEFFADADEPMNVAIIMDTSGSTGDVLSSIKKAAKQFLATFESRDKGMVISFDDEIHVLGKLQSDKVKLRKAINEATTVSQGVWDPPKTRSTMTMNDAIYQVVTKDFAEVRGRKAIILLTDGFEGGNKISLSKLRATLTESDTLVYPIIYQTYDLASFFPKNTKTVTLAELLSLPIYSNIKDFAEVTGGRVYSADVSNFEGAFQRIADELKKQYTVGFYPTNSEIGVANNITIKVRRKDVVVRSKQTIRLKPHAPPISKSAH